MSTFPAKCQHVSSISHKSIKKYRIFDTVSQNDFLGAQGCSQKALKLRALWLHLGSPNKSFLETVSQGAFPLLGPLKSNLGGHRPDTLH